jgi:hypothetical protein
MLGTAATQTFQLSKDCFRIDCFLVMHHPSLPHGNSDQPPAYFNTNRNYMIAACFNEPFSPNLHTISTKA